ncbi:hypothetical protein [Latilactobacillus sakei]|uniref:hypothetical protein n=1 Tax=Latilactobacillus sakei TaxID=1599 RepID=UPI000B61DB99|nr:hypothetical protein [Latilactobacillus sakei]ASN13597.1 hypothetical protein B4V05_10215 [Latilactobacillus sakei]UTB73281.1 hypothetical protein A4W72_11020 [Latilactobacillus curvatus]
MSIQNNLKINGDKNTVYQNIDNSKTDIYLSNGTPQNTPTVKTDPLPLRIADWLIDSPDKILNVIDDFVKPTDNSTSSSFISLFMTVTLWIIVLAIAIVASKPLSWLAIICSITSICYYIYLHIHRQQDVNIFFYFQQLSILIIMLIFNINFSKDMALYNQHTAINLHDINSFLNGIKDNIIFWWNTFTSIFSSFPDLKLKCNT